ncbi:MAG: transporter substrate-binding domain-containing protein [Paucibacter sp.]|nr:transporter substrate-binding domain-containing protein [Roseateles sp.]
MSTRTNARAVRAVDALLAVALVASSPIALGSTAGNPTCDRVIVTADPSYPPFHWYDGHRLRGASIDLTEEVLRRLGLRYEIRYVGPWMRVLSKAQAGQVDMVVTLKDTPERRVYLSYVPTPAFDNRIAVFVAKSRAFPFAGVDDLAAHRGGVSAGNELGGAQGRAIAERLHLEIGLDARHNFEKLKIGRIDYFLTGYYTGQAILDQRADGAEFVALRPFLLSTQNYVAFVSSSPCAKFVSQFDSVLASLNRSGAGERALQDNLELWRNQLRSDH